MEAVLVLVLLLVAWRVGRYAYDRRRRRIRRMGVLACIASRMEDQGLPFLVFELDGYRVVVLNRADELVLRHRGGDGRRFDEDRAWCRALELLREDATP